ncbi:uncharacterized protein V1516DRAFT_55701 [Lipomyces oligophaga]|uniref:uncharacterized protein n=1 Tax=Lipomyces oligophaga TaxID=45792 RepID=UPI0034CEE0F2
MSVEEAGLEQDTSSVTDQFSALCAENGIAMSGLPEEVLKALSAEGDVIGSLDGLDQATLESLGLSFADKRRVEEDLESDLDMAKRQKLDKHVDIDAQHGQSELPVDLEQEINELFSDGIVASNGNVDSIDDKNAEQKTEHNISVDDLSWLEELPGISASEPSANQHASTDASSSMITPPYQTSDQLSEIRSDDTLKELNSGKVENSQIQLSTTPLATPFASPAQAVKQNPLMAITLSEADTLKRNLADAKTKILSQHSLVTTYAALKSAYTQVCETSRTNAQQLSASRRQLTDLEQRYTVMANKARAATAKADELMGVIKRLPDQSEILKTISRLEQEVVSKNRQLETLKTALAQSKSSGMQNGLRTPSETGHPIITSAEATSIN